MAAEQGSEAREPETDVPNPGVVRTVLAVIGGLVAWCLVGMACGIMFEWLRLPSGVAEDVAGASISFLAACGMGYCTGRIARRRSWLPVTVVAVLLILAYSVIWIYMGLLSGIASAALTASLVANLIGLPVVALCWARIGEAVSRRAVRQERAKLVKLGAISLGAILVVSLIGWGASHVLSAPTDETKELDQTLAELEASGAPMSLAEAAPEAVPDEENGALLYMKAFKQLDDLSPWQQRYEQQFLDGHLFGSDVPLDEVVRFFDDSQAIYELLRAAAQRPRYRFPLDYEKGFLISEEHLHGLRVSVWYLSARAQAMARAGRMEEAADTTLASFGPGRSARNEPTIISWLASVALHDMALETLREVAATGNLRPEQTTALAANVSWPEVRKALTRAYVGERATGIQLFEDVREGKIGPRQLLGEEAAGNFANGFYATPVGARILARDELFYLDAADDVIAVTPLPYADAKERMQEWKAELTPPKLDLVATVILPSPSGITICARLEADEVVSLTGLRLIAYRDETGRYPADLAELKGADTEPLPVDPFTGAPLVYQPRENGFLLYSFGPDEEDDAGGDDDVAWNMSRR